MDAENVGATLPLVPQRPLRVGGIHFLNAQPLTHTLLGDAPLPLRMECAPPSELAMGLAAGRFDLALVPVVAWAPCADASIVPGVGISSYGPVWSIKLYHRGRLEDVRRVAVDTSSRTSVLLLQLLFRRRFGARPEFRALPPRSILAALEAGESGDFDAALLIGDAALSVGPALASRAGWRELDLGAEWTAWTGLPFVYAVWSCRGVPEIEEVAETLIRHCRASRDRGVARIDEIARTFPLPPGFGYAQAIDYLHRIIHFELGEAELEGLGRFLGLVAEEGLASIETQLRFLAPSDSLAVPGARS